MRIIHTSDWHLGRSLCGMPLLPAQASFADWLVEFVRAERVDAVLVSGDIYDRALPSPETVGLLSETLTQLVDAGAQVVVTSGNHDSSIRLGFASSLLARAGLHIRTDPQSLGSGIPVGDGVVYPLPYLEPAVEAGLLDARERSHAGVLGAAMTRVREAATTSGAGPVVVMAHAFVAGGVASESERDISVGGVQIVPASLFNDISYAALGHLHRPQAVSDRIRYSGSPLAMSFSEADHVTSVNLVDVGVEHCAVELVPTPVVRRLVRLRGELDSLLTDARHTHAESAWCHVTLTDPLRPPGALDRLRRRFPDVLALDFEPAGAVVEARAYAARTRPGRSELDVCTDFLGHVRGGVAATDAERALLQRAVEETRVGAAVDADERGREAGVA